MISKNEETRCVGCGRLLAVTGKLAFDKEWLEKHKNEFAGPTVIIMENETEEHKDFCIDCGMIQLKKRWLELRSSIWIEIPDLKGKVANLNYNVEVVESQRSRH